jgi:hypothetical protein
VGILGAIALILKPYLATGQVTLEQVAIAVFVAVVCYFIPAKPSAKDQAAMVATVSGIVDGALSSKLPAMLTQQRAVGDLVTSADDALIAATGADQEVQAPPAPIPVVAAG